MSQITVKHLILDGLGYCCLWAFFTAHRQTALIATRLGVTKRAVQKYKALYRQECYDCENNPRCLRLIVLRARRR